MAYAQAPGGVAPRKLSKTGIVWAIVVFAVTAIIGIVMIVLGVVAIADTLDDFQQVGVPGSSTLQLDEGEQWIFVGGSGVDVFDVEVSVTDPDGDRVAITRDTGQSADSNGDSFQSLGRFDAERSGRYEIETEGPARADVRVGEIPFLRIGLLLGGGFAIGGLGFLVAAVILIVALVRRSRAKKENRLAAWGPPQPGSPSQTTYGQPGGPGYGQPGAVGYGQPGTPPPPASSVPPPAPSAPSTPPPSTPPPPASTPPPPSSTPPPPSSTPPPPPPG